MTKGREIKFKVGRGSHRGDVTLSAGLPESLTLSVSYKGERAATVVLTAEQVEELRRALDEVAPETNARAGGVLRLAA